MALREKSYRRKTNNNEHGIRTSFESVSLQRRTDSTEEEEKK